MASPEDASIVWEDGGGGGGSLPQIQDSSGNLLPIEPIVQLDNSLRGTDDPLNTRTVIADNSEWDITEGPFWCRGKNLDGTIIGTTRVQSTGNFTGGLNTATITNAATIFKVNDGICVLGAGATASLTVPAVPTATISAGVVTAGVTTRSYKLVGATDKYEWTAASLAVTVANCPDIIGQSSVPALQFGGVLCTVGNDGLGHDTGQGTYVSQNIADFTNVSIYQDSTLLGASGEMLVWAQTNLIENGMYIYTVSGARCSLTRQTISSSGWTPALYARFLMFRGNSSGQVWAITKLGTAGGGVIGTDPVVFEQVPYVSVAPEYFQAKTYATANIANLAACPVLQGGGSYTLTVGDGILLPFQANQTQNGFYRAGTPSGGFVALTRDASYDSAAEILPGTLIQVQHGPALTGGQRNTNGFWGTLWTQTATVVTVGTDPITFVQQDVRYWLVYANNGSGNYTYHGTMNANPYWGGPNVPPIIAYRDYGTAFKQWCWTNTNATSGNFPNTAPSTPQNARFQTRITGIIGNSVTMADPAPNGGTGVAVKLDNFLGLTAAIAATSGGGTSNVSKRLRVQEGNFAWDGLLTVDRDIWLSGAGSPAPILGGSTVFTYGDGGGIRIVDAANSPNGSAGTSCVLEGFQLVPEHLSVPSGGGLFTAQDIDPLNRGPLPGAAIYIQTRATLRNINVAKCVGSNFVVYGSDSSGGNNCNETQFNTCGAGASIYHGFYVIGDNTNVCHFVACSVSGALGDAFMDYSFLGSSWDSSQVTSANGYAYRVQGSQLHNIYLEAAAGTVYCAGSSAHVDAVFLQESQVHPASVTNGANIYQGNKISPQTFGQMNGAFTVQIGGNDGTTVLLVASGSDLPDGNVGTAPPLLHSVAHLTTNPGALSFTWNGTGNVGARWMGANATGPGILRFPHGLELTDQSENTVARFGGTAGKPTSPGVYSPGCFFIDVNPILGLLGWSVNTLGGIANFAWSSGGSAFTGGVYSSGGNMYQATVLTGAPGLATGVFGSSAPVATGLNGQVFLTKITGATTDFQAVSHPSPKFGSSLSDADDVSLNMGSNRMMPTITADRNKTLIVSGISSGQRGWFFKPASAGDFKATFLDGTNSSAYLCELPGGCNAAVEFQYDGTHIQIVGGYGFSQSHFFRRYKTLAEIIALPAGAANNGNEFYVEADGSHWRFSSGSTASDSTGIFANTLTNNAGRLIRTDPVVDVKLAVGFGTANNAVLFTVPTFANDPYAAGIRLAVLSSRWEITSDFTGGSASAIGISSSSAKASTAGDLLGGASGDVAATLTHANLFAGTAGPKTGLPATVLVGGDTIKFNQITSTFTAGAGFAHIVVQVMT